MGLKGCPHEKYSEKSATSETESYCKQKLLSSKSRNQILTVGFVHIDEFIKGPEGWEIVNSTDMNDEVRKGIKCR